MKKLLVLGGTYFQVPAIEYAKNQGYYVITCDYLPDNPGHKYADEYHNVSTTDKDAVLELAKKLCIDGILCFASDPAAPTAAYVSEQMNLPGNPLHKIELFGEKHKWRNFLAEHGFNTPKAKSYRSLKELLDDIWEYPVMVKPVDSSGSKGVTKVLSKDGLKEAFYYALEFSRAKEIIVEEFIERVGPQIGGDGFFGEDKLDFVCLGDQVVDEAVNPYVPCGMTFPAKLSKDLFEKIKNELERAILLSGMKNLSFNLEVMIDKKGRIFLMEIGPRNGGNCIPEVIHNYTGVDMVALAVEAAMGKTIPIKPQVNDKLYAYYALHSDEEGVYKGYSILPSFKGKVTKSYIFKEEGDQVGRFHGSNETIGILLLEFNSYLEMNTFFKHPCNYLKVNVQ